jgi:hypothetical protein
VVERLLIGFLKYVLRIEVIGEKETENTCTVSTVTVGYTVCFIESWLRRYYRELNERIKGDRP